LSIIFGQTDIKLYDYILLHGINSDASSWNGTDIKSMVQNDFKLNNMDQVDYGDIYDEFIATIAQEVYDDIANQTGDETIVIAHSMGGLVTRSLIEQYTREKISTLITIGTPHAGSGIATSAGQDKANELAARLGWAAASDIFYLLSNASDYWLFGILWDILSDEGITSLIVNEVYTALIDYTLSEFVGVADHDSGEDLRPGSTFLNNLNTNTANEEMIDRFSIRGVETWPQLYRYFGSLTMDDDDALVDFIDLLTGATEAMATYCWSAANYWAGQYNYWNNLYAYWYWEWYYAWDPYYIDYSYQQMMDADYQCYFASYQFSYCDLWYQISALDHEEYTDIPTEYNSQVMYSASNDAMVSASSQTWSVIDPSNQFSASGANHSDERDNANVLAALDDIATIQHLYPWQGYNGAHFMLGDVTRDMALDVTDVAQYSPYIGGSIEWTPYQILVADVTEEGEIDILDIVMLVDWVLNGVSRYSDHQALLADVEPSTISIGSDNGLMRGEGSGFAITINSDVPIKGFQLDIISDQSEGEELVLELADITSTFEIYYRAIDEGTTRVIVYSLDGLDIPVGQQDVLWGHFEGLARSEYDVLIASESAILATAGGGSVPVADTQGIDMPAGFALQPAFPNPFNPETTISYNLPEDARVSLKIYDIMGREVAALVDDARATAEGQYSVVWNAEGLASGSYIVQFVTPRQTRTQKLMFLK